MNPTPGPGGSSPGPRRRSRWTTAAWAGVLAVPVVEVVVFVAVADRIGAWALLWLLAAAVVGAVLVSRSGRAAWAALQESARTGRSPARGLTGALLTALAGVLLIVPGFVTDVLAVLVLLPPMRWLARAGLVAFGTRVLVVRAGASPGGRVVPGTVLRPDDDTSPAGGRPSSGDRGAGETVVGEILPGPDDEPDGR